jgi:hypothetical protein
MEVCWLIMKVPYTKSGKCGNTVWQRARYGQISYAAFIPTNPRTPAQVAVRGNFRAVSARWRALAQAQRDVWNAVARTKWSKPRLFQRGRLTGFTLFVKVNVARVNRGIAQLDLPLECPRSSKLTASSLFCINRFDQPPVGPMLFLQANHLIEGCQHAPRRSTAGASAPI